MRILLASTFTIESERVSLPNACIELSRYDDGTTAVLATSGLDTEVLSTNLVMQGLVPRPDEFFCRDYSEFSGVPDALVASGLAMKVSPVRIGSLQASGWLMRLAVEVPR